MATKGGDRSAHFPAIERKHGEPISFWLDRLEQLEETTYPAQMAYLQEEHGFSRAHANAVVMWFRGSTSSQRFSGPDDWFANQEPAHSATARAIFASVQERHPDLELVVAWNHPMLRHPSGAYVIGLSAAANHVLVNPFSGDVLDACADRLAAYTTNKKTFAVPVDWQVDHDLLDALVNARLAEL